MGDRGQVKIGGVYLYTHWGAIGLIEDVQTALNNKWRWHDLEYLARIIFDVMTAGEQGEEAGYGIGIQKHGDIWRLIEITKDNIRVIDNDKEVFNGTFEEFLKFKPKQ